MERKPWNGLNKKTKIKTIAGWYTPTPTNPLAGVGEQCPPGSPVRPRGTQDIYQHLDPIHQFLSAVGTKKAKGKNRYQKMIWQLWQWYIHIHSKYDAYVYNTSTYIYIYMEYPSSNTHIDVFLPLRRGGAAPSRTLQLPRVADDAWFTRRQIFWKKKCHFPTGAFFPQFFSPSLFFVYIYILCMNTDR